VEDVARAIGAARAERAFSGVVRVDRDGAVFAEAFGLANRALALPNEIDTRFATASATKGLTALVVLSLVDDGTLELAAPVRRHLGRDLPLISDDVTVEHLLSHRSGIGDYLDEDEELDLDDYLLPVPVHELATTEDFLAVLDGHEPKFAPGAGFSYCNGGYVVLALVAERASGRPFHDLVADRVCEPAGMRDTAFLRSDELPDRTALGYLGLQDVDRTNVFHLPVRGNGDGGVYTTVADVRALWTAFFAGRIVPPALVERMVRPTTEDTSHGKRYGLGFWLHQSTDVVILEGMDAGVSFYSAHDPVRDTTYTVVSNTADGAWPVARALRDLLG
jgi:CubicO group peptidase (beta-lactamase class C family)